MGTWPAARTRSIALWAALGAAIAAYPDPSAVPPSAASGLTMSYAGAMSVAEQYPEYASQITTAAKTSFLAGDQQAYIAGILAVLIGAALVFFIFPKPEKERELLEEYSKEDGAAISERTGKPETAPAPGD